MEKFQIMTVSDAKQRLADEKVQLVDIRDARAYQEDHIEHAFHLSNGSVNEFIKQTAYNTPIFVICYHGNSSKGVAQYLCEQGYLNVYSIAGGMVAWRLAYPYG